MGWVDVLTGYVRHLSREGIPMKWCVVGGAGAIGSLFSRSLQFAGEEVAILGSSRESIDSVTSRGLAVTEMSGEIRSYPVVATANAADIGFCDVVVFLIKAHQTRAAARSAAPLVGPSTLILSLQNGWGNLEILEESFGDGQLGMGVTYQGASLIAPGQILHTLIGPTIIGPYHNMELHQQLVKIGAVLSAAGIETIQTDEVKTEIWKKLSLNAAALPVSALTRLATGKVAADPEIFRICAALVREAVEVGRAMSFQIDADERIAYVKDIMSRAGEGRTSMLQDVDARRKTEIEVINGAILREADAFGIDVPFNRLMVTMVRGLEASWTQQETAG